MEFKAAPAFTTGIEGRVVRGVFAVHGNVDEGGDRSHPGSFLSVAKGGRLRARFVWQHRTDEPPVAAIREIRELSRAELPASVLAFAPDATGGVEVAREYLDTPRGNEILIGIKAGAIEEMSYAYDVTAHDYTDVPGLGTVREIRGVTLYDISDVLWGMNPATIAAKRLPLAEHSETVLAAVKGYTKRLQDLNALRAKEGRVLSGANRKRISEAVEALANAKTALEDLLTATETEPKTSLLAEMQREYQRHIELSRRIPILGGSK